MHTWQPAREPRLTASASVVTRSWMSSRMPSLKVRMVPVISTLSGMMFWRTPPRMVPRVTTAGSSVRSMVRLTTVCSPSTTCAAVTMGSTPAQGAAPCVWRPSTVIFSVSLLAMVGPGR